MSPKPRPAGNQKPRPSNKPRQPRARAHNGAALRGRDRLIRGKRFALLLLQRLGRGGRMGLAALTLVLVVGGMTALLGGERYNPVPAGPALTPQEEIADATSQDEPGDAADEDAAERADLPTFPVAPPEPPALATETPAPTPEPTQSAAPPPKAPVQTAMVRAMPPVPAAPAGVPAWQQFAVPANPATGVPRVVIVIDDMGVDRKRSDRVVALPGPLTLAWLPYARDLPAQTVSARTVGHELIVHMPMEPTGRDDPGPGALLTRLDNETLRQRLATNLSAFDGFVGINNHMGSRFTADPSGMAVVFAELASRGLLFLDSRTTADTKAGPMAAHYQVPMLSRDVFLDHQMTATAVAASLAKVEEIARRKGVAIAIGHPHDVTTDALRQWLPTLAAKGIQLVPLTAVMAQEAPP